VQEGLTDLW